MVADPPSSNNPSIEELLASFSKGTYRQRRGLLTSIEARADELLNLGEIVLSSFDRESDDFLSQI